MPSPAASHHSSVNRQAGQPRFQAAVIGCSAGGLEALKIVLGALPPNLDIAVIVVAHTAHDGDHLLPSLLGNICKLPVSEARERDPVEPGRIYVAPPNYHLLIEPNRGFALSVDERVCFVRPSIDVLFCSAADAYREQLIGLILTGANQDGALGLKAVKDAGGYTLAQDPSTAYADTMPKAAIETGAVDRVLPLDALAADILRACTLSVES
ncbi:chemotaxis protein CheB [Methylomonas sp. LL1]|uniref:chemotaxis protein CheB n=1 Tax=Methylomonas sp. LL1 TaxID=2785785 RepID=UPI0018C4351F|nr:chemotaxis protein CheB [Methylomonas sp. LL1]QPK64770.1 chemotaxis protein CheB [Methylomonas sp. LL1]